jgi:hypothetical protein
VEPLGEAAVAAASGSPDEQCVVLALQAHQREAQQEIDRRSKAYQNFDDALRVADRIREALAAIARKRRR